MSRAILQSAALLFLAACSSTNTNSSEGSGGTSSTGGSAGTAAPGGSGGATGGSGGATGGSGGAAGSPQTFCTGTKSALCADFELEGLTKLLVSGKPGNFAPVFEQGKGTVALKSGLFSPNAVALTAPSLSPGDPQAHAELRALAPAPGTSVAYEVDVRVDTVDKQAPEHTAVALGGIELGTGAAPYKAHIYLDPAWSDDKIPVFFGEIGTGVLGGSGYEFRTVHPTTAVVINRNEWVRLFLTLNLPAAPLGEGNATLEFQPAGQVKATVLQTTIHPPTLGQPTMNLALIATASVVTQAGWSVTFDNATLVVQ